jgi:cell wall assembly regulator SMI1
MLLPLHHDPLHSFVPPPPNYPPLARTWSRIRAWLSREIPELGDTLNYGILPQDLAQIEMQFGFALPNAVKESYLVVDGQEAESAAGCPEGLFFGLTLLPLEDVLEEWRFWREVDEDASTGANPRLQGVMRSFPPGWIRKEYSQRGWIPLIADKAGNYLGVDLNPGEGGSVGQVICFGRDFDTKVVMWRGDGRDGWAKWLASFAEELESGETYEIGAGNDTSDGSEDGVGYDSYFQDGHGRGQGEGRGDSGYGGLRLTGEYRGWSTLEAWADRSLRKWHEIGAIPPSFMEFSETNQVSFIFESTHGSFQRDVLFSPQATLTSTCWTLNTDNRATMGKMQSSLSLKILHLTHSTPALMKKVTWQSKRLCLPFRLANPQHRYP